MSHTPGPWKWVIHDKSMASIEGPRDDFDHVLSCSPCESCIARLKDDESPFNHCTMPNDDDARLIAAAPDLLEALVAIVKSLSDDDEEGLIEYAEQMIAARAAIAKAKGQS